MGYKDADQGYDVKPAHFKGLFFSLILSTLFLFSHPASAVHRGFNVYKIPGKKSSIFTNTRNNTFSYTGKKRGRYRQVRYSKRGKAKYAWVHRKALTSFERKRGRSKSSDLAHIDFVFPKNPVLNPKYNIRSRPSTGSKKRGKAKDKKYQITQEISPNGRWVKLKCKGCGERWVHVDALREGPPAKKAKPLAKKKDPKAPPISSEHLNIGTVDQSLQDALPTHDNTPDKFKHRINGKMTVTNVNEFVNMRAAPSPGSEKLDRIPLGAEVDYIDTDKYGWHRIGYNGKIGYVSPKYLKKSTPKDKSVAKSRKEAYKSIARIANKHNRCMNRSSNPNKRRRRAGVGRSSSRAGRSTRVALKRVIGYYHGTTISFARSLCRSNSSPIKKAMLHGTKRKWKRKNRDMLRLFSPGSGFADRPSLNVKLYGPIDGTEKNLISLYTLMLSKGMRESGGNYRDGIDRSASNTRARTTEAGLYQTSYNVHDSMSPSAKKAAHQIMSKYRKNPQACMRSIYDKKRPNTPGTNSRYYGKPGSPAYEFQKLMRTCPAAATEHAVIATRQVMQHFGPVRRKEVLPYKECEPMFEEVYSYVKANPSLCDSLAIQPTPAKLEFHKQGTAVSSAH